MQAGSIFTPIFASIILATLLDPLGVLVHRLPKGLGEPSVGAHCAGSMTALGEVVGASTTRKSTVVDMWFVRYENKTIGAIVHTFGDTYWYEDLAAAFYEQITPTNADELHMPGFSIGGCFSHPLAI